MTSRSFRRVVAEHQLAVFFVMSYLLAWIPWLLSLAGLTHGGGINSFGPVMAALLVAGIVDGGAGLRDLGRRLVRWRVAGWCYVVALLLPVVLMGLAAVLNVGLGAPRPTDAHLGAWRGALAAAPLTVVFGGPLGEELGWRGYALPRLLERGSPLWASLVLGAVWAGWHLPLFAAEPGIWIVPMVIWIMAAAVLLTWLHQRTGGSVLIATLLHGSVNVVGGGYISRMFTGADSDRQFWLAAGLYVIVAVVASRFLKRPIAA